MSMKRFAVVAATVALMPFLQANAQSSAPPNGMDLTKDTSILKLPAGQRAAIYEFEDLECPACAHAFPIVHEAVSHYHVAFIRHDFPLKMHLWSKDAAITARYLQDKVSPDMAEQFRRDVFAHQVSISSKDDLQSYTRQWFQAHNQQVPFVMDPAGRFGAEVQADETLGERLGLQHTPTIVVVGPKGWVEVNDVTQLYTTIDQVLAQSPAVAAKPAAKRATTTAKN
jgi:protein-disulfide isomerase